ncbi:MAG: dialkylresorcinol condensing enzyme DarA [Flavobacteriales bacterium]|nr:MAG: dialkylresorcinol condensing enzyme DarA [Flavobacteriales bacterium]
MKILVIYYSQTGQLTQIVKSVLTPLEENLDISVHYEEIKLKKPFPFPWTAVDFFDAMPESVMEIPSELEPFKFNTAENYDLIVLGYQPWYLSPSIPMSSFLQSPAAKVLEGKPVITILGCRNMWLMAQEKMKKRLVAAGGKLVGNITLVDKSSNLKSVFTILRWLLKGEKGSAGVSEEDIRGARTFGEIILQKLKAGDFNLLQRELNEKGAVKIKPNLLVLEKRGNKAFNVWAKFIAAKGEAGSTKRKFRVKLLLVCLPTALFLLSPVTALFSYLTLLVKRRMLEKEMKYFSFNTLAEKQ